MDPVLTRSGPEPDQLEIKASPLLGSRESAPRRRRCEVCSPSGYVCNQPAPGCALANGRFGLRCPFK